MAMIMDDPVYQIAFIKETFPALLMEKLKITGTPTGS